MAGLPAQAWVPHFNRGVYEGAWTGVALRSPGGVATQLYPDPAPTSPFADTALLGTCPALSRALAQWHCPVTSARLLALAPGAVIKDHRDYRLGWKDGEIRIHVAIATNDEVEFLLDGRPVALGLGEAWYLDLGLVHRVENRSSATRVHLVVDCVVDDWMTELMGRALADTSDALPSGVTTQRG
jgi:hypothetical protein